jgi:uncharacterized protein
MTERALLLDASVVVDLFVTSENSGLARDLLEQRAHEVMVSDLAVGEYGSAVSRLRRIGVVDGERAQQLFVLFDVWRARNAIAVTTEASDIRAAGSHVRHPDVTLRMPDAIHIATAHRLGAALATFDVRQADAARKLGVGLFNFVR